ncbi:hypothetical protein CPter291_1341 [Collimonas pratensis]|uniref:Uncharacterized protein n=1 Tax=Collimonas pratensis TaxID=279113 RepID=A0ABN4M5U9_9BURK|nr:hypothetical protein CPter291_1341 [Collimonas pratensis]
MGGCQYPRQPLSAHRRRKWTEPSGVRVDFRGVFSRKSTLTPHGEFGERQKALHGIFPSCEHVLRSPLSGVRVNFLQKAAESSL